MIGGYAVRAYTGGYRSTKDIDLVTTREGLGSLKALLRNLGYDYRDTEFGIAGSKRFDGGFIDLHISVGKIFDVSTGLTFPVTDEFFERARTQVMRGYHEESGPFAAEAPVAEVESILLLKLIPTGRAKDTVDLTSLIIDRRDQIDLEALSEQCRESGLRDHIITQLRNYADLTRKGELEKIWFSLTGLRLSHNQRRDITRFVRNLIDKLRKDDHNPPTAETLFQQDSDEGYKEGEGTRRRDQRLPPPRNRPRKREEDPPRSSTNTSAEAPTSTTPSSSESPSSIRPERRPKPIQNHLPNPPTTRTRRTRSTKKDLGRGANVNRWT